MIVLSLVKAEAERRKRGEPADSRFDLALDVLRDLMDALTKDALAQAELGETLVLDDEALD